MAAVLRAGDDDDGASFRDNPGAQETLDRYFEACQVQQAFLRNVSMEVDIEAKLPRLNKTGKLQALRYISRLGQVTYRALRFVGDNTVKQDIIARYLSAESTARQNGTIAISRDNYKFRYRGLYGSGDWQLHLFELNPRAKRPGLFKGWLWVEARTNMPVREQGYFVKSPSIFLKRVEFTRDYSIRDGVAVPSRIDSAIDTRVVGRAEITVRFSNFARQEETSQLAAQAFLEGRPSDGAGAQQPE